MFKTNKHEFAPKEIMKNHIANIDKQNPTTNCGDTDGRRPFQTFIPGDVRAPGGSGQYIRPQVRRPFSSGLRMLLALLAIAPMSSVHSQEYTFTTLAGPDGGPGAIDGTGAEARFNHPEAWRWTLQATSMWRTSLTTRFGRSLRAAW